MQLWVNINNAVLICVIDPVERLTVEEFVHHPFLSEQAPERTLRFFFLSALPLLLPSYDILGYV